jgi:hypothetical protein
VRKPPGDGEVAKRTKDVSKKRQKIQEKSEEQQSPNVL